MTTPLVITEQTVRDYFQLNAATDSRYSDANIGSNIRAATGFLERNTGRFFYDRPGFTMTFTTQGRAQLFIPGLRTPTAVVWQGAALSWALPPINTSASWFLPDIQQSGLYTGFQFRVFRVPEQGGERWKANPNWWDQGDDSPYHPMNRGGGWTFNSLPNDLAITGDWGYAVADLPDPFLHALKVLAGYYTMRPGSVLATVAMTPGGSTQKLMDLPSEVRDFIIEWQLGEQAVGI